MTKTRRISQAALGLAFVVVGGAGVAATWAPAPALAQTGSADSHELMDEMMDQCASMMEAMGGQGMSNMERGMMGR